MTTAVAAAATGTPVPATTARPVTLHQHPASGIGHSRLLLLHGLANSSTLWSALLSELPGYEMWTADLPWRGDGAMTWCHRTDLLDPVDEALAGVPGGVDVVVAHSFSANLLLALLDREHARGNDPLARSGTRGLVLVSPFYRSRPGDFTWQTMSDYLNGFETIMEEGIRIRSGGRTPRGRRRDMARQLCERVGPYGWVRFFQVYLDTPWLRPEVVTVPCLVLAGADDLAADPAESRLLADRLTRAELQVLPRCGHFLMTEQRSLFARAVDDFVHSVASRTQGVET